MLHYFVPHRLIPHYKIAGWVIVDFLAGHEQGRFGVLMACEDLPTLH